MGRLKFRTSYGQNVLSHSAEVARLAGIMAKEVGLDAHVAVRAAFLHDIGKAIDREMQGTHLELGIDFLRKHGESEPVVMAMAAHHMDIDWPSLEAMIVQAADAISAARPGARRDILESYVKRLEKLEGIADSFKGVSKSFALQAGREIRIMVESEKISDEEAIWLSKDIARRIENELEYPGPDQGHRHPRNPRGRLREVDQNQAGAGPGHCPYRVTVSDLTERELIARIARTAPAAARLADRRHRRRCGGRRAGAEPARGPERRRACRGHPLRPALYAARRDWAPGARRQPERPRGDGRGPAARAPVHGAAPGPASRRLRRARIAGSRRLALRHRLHLVGGNLTRSPGPLMIDVTVTGTVKRRQVLTRGGARPGDGLYVTGSIGGAAAGLDMLRHTTRAVSEAKALIEGDTEAQAMASCAHRYLYPEPRVRTGLALGEIARRRRAWT